MRKKQSQKTRLKKRVNAYRIIGTNFVYMLTSDFKGVFRPMMIEKDIETIKRGFGFAIDDLIEVCSEDECQRLNMRLDCYQLDKKYD
jgi:hypothetical protein